MTATTHRPLRSPSPVSRWMKTKSPAERRTAVLLLGAVAVAAIWATLWVPLMRDTASLRLARAANVAAQAEARDRAKEASELSRTGAVAAAVDARAELDRILAQPGVRPAVTSLDWRDGRAQVVFAAISYDRLIALLDVLQHSARLRAVEATITARVEPGMVRAELTLTR